MNITSSTRRLLFGWEPRSHEKVASKCSPRARSSLKRRKIKDDYCPPMTIRPTLARSLNVMFPWRLASTSHGESRSSCSRLVSFAFAPFARLRFTADVPKPLVARRTLVFISGNTNSPSGHRLRISSNQLNGALRSTAARILVMHF